MEATQRDHEVLEAAFGQHRAFVRQRMVALGVPRRDLDDATQDIFLVMARRLADFEPGRPIRNWAAGIARRVARRYRAEPGRSIVSLDEIDEQRTREDQSPESHARRHEALRVLEQFLRNLDEDRWRVFVLAELEGLRGTEIASELGINLDTTYARLRSARRDFQRTLKRHQAKDRRGLPALLPLWLYEHPKRMVLPVVGLLGIIAIAVSTSEHRGCTPSASKPNEDPSDSAPQPAVAERSPDRSETISIPPFIEVNGETELVRPSPTDPRDTETSTQWFNAGSGHSFGEDWAATRNARYRIVNDKYAELEIEYVMDEEAIEDVVDLRARVNGENANELAPKMEGTPMPCLAAEFITDGLEVVDGSPAWTMSLQPGETKQISVTFEAAREGIIRSALRTRGCDTEEGGGTTTFLTLIAEDGKLRRCREEDSCLSWSPRDRRDLLDPENPLPERTRVEIANECPHLVRYVVRPESRGISPEDPIHEIEPGQTRTIEVDAAHGFVKVDEDGDHQGSVWASGENVRLRFRGPDCATSISSGRPPRSWPPVPR